MLPFEFTVPGPPVSHQSRNKAKLAAWRQMVRTAASARWGAAAPLGVPLRITVSYYHQGLAVRIDNDNMVKPLQDALIGLVYQDDRLITDTIVRKTSIDGLFRVRGYPLVLLEALSQGDEFLHVVIDEAPHHEHPLR
jgi:Holliday junction resolvase RusA-like endonuclease